MLTIPLEKLAYIVEKARQYDVEAAPAGLEEGSDGPDDNERAILEEGPDKPTAAELRDAIAGLDADKRQELLALLRVGRGDRDREGWREARGTADADTADYLLGTLLLGDYLEDGLAVIGRPLEGLQRG